ncbi:hypothetical protein ACVWW5_007947 [Bradyrhizobium sp. LM3.4]
MDPFLVDLKPAQLLRDLDSVAAEAKIGRRPLQHGDMRAFVRNIRNQRCGRRARADHDDLLVREVDIFRPGLRMNDAALEAVRALPFRRVAFRMAVIALAHPEEVRRESFRFAGVGRHRLDGPEILLARPARRNDLVLIADVAGDIVVVDHLVHVGEDFLGGCDGRSDPGLEAITEGVEIAVRADAGIAMRGPGAAERRLRFQDDEARARKLLCHVIGAADARDAGADDQHIEMFRSLFGRDVTANSDIHCCYLPCLFLWPPLTERRVSSATGVVAHRASALKWHRPNRGQITAPHPSPARSAISSRDRA